MATTCTFQSYEPDTKGGTILSQGTLSLNDVVVNTTPTATGGWNTATVHADVQRRIFVGASDAATAGVGVGWYEQIGTATFRRQPF